MPLILLAYLLAAIIGYLGYRARALSASGAVAAGLVGGTVFGFGGLGYAVLLVVFFASSSLLSFFKADDPAKSKAAETFDKGGRRDAAQVIANGGAAALWALLGYLFPSAFLTGAFLGSLAAATADTWATELGVLSKQQPRLVTTGVRVPAGTSGGVTLQGSLASTVGALLIGLSAAILSYVTSPGLISEVATVPVLVALSGGLAGSFFDSLLGATVQAGYFCPTCNKPTESKVHRCGTWTTRVKGIGWISNDLVNLAATVLGGVVGGAIASVL